MLLYNDIKGGRKMKNRWLKSRKLGISLLAVALTAVLLITACAPGPPPEEQKVVKIGYIAPLTGGPAAIMQTGWRNFEDWLTYYKEVGTPGLELPDGVTVELVWADSSFEAAKAISIYERMVDDVVFFHLPSPVEAYACKTRLERDDMAAMLMAVDEVLMYPPGQMFTIFCTESERFAAACDWIMENWKEDRPPRIGMMGTDTATGRAAEVMGTAYAESLGIEMLPFESIPYLPLDASPQLLRLAEEGADVIYMQAHWGSSPPVLRDAQRLGLVGKIRFAGATEDGIGVSMLDMGPAAEGFFQTKNFPWYEEVPIVYDIFRMREGRLDTQGGVACTLQYGPVTVEAIKIAIEQVGYENLDGRAVKEAFYSIKDFDPYDLGRPVTYTREDNRGSPMVRIYEIQGGRVVPATDWRDAHMLVP
jgi:branched-chain amino acid transport system substrate-binding protein